MFLNKLNLYKEVINKELEKFIEILDNKECIYVFDAIKYSLFGGGKLLRPVLTLAVCEMFCKDYKRATAFSCAVEFMHVGSLIHDDLPCMDNDSKRRGKDSCHIKFNEAAAVLAADALFCSSFEILTYSKEYGLKDEDIVKAVYLLSKMFGTKGTIAGQDMDMFLKKNKITKEVIFKMVEYKTCCLIKAACLLGAIAACASEFEKKAIEKFAYYFGISFQIIDDILDFDEDEKEKKLNFLLFFNKDEANELAKTYTKKAFEVLRDLKDNEFLFELTKKALFRKY